MPDLLESGAELTEEVAACVTVTSTPLTHCPLAELTAMISWYTPTRLAHCSQSQSHTVHNIIIIFIFSFGA